MEQNVNSCRGFTLIEALVSLFILAVLLIGLLSGLITTTKYNLINHARDEAKLIAQECSENIRSTLFDNIKINEVSCNDNSTTVNSPCIKTDKTTSDNIQRKIRDFTLDYHVGWNISQESSNLKKVIITVCWKISGKNYTYTTETLIGRD